MAKREFLQLADHYDPAKHNVAGWFISEKLDGTRCFWDGGLSRGLPTEQVPWASIIDPKTGKKKAKIKPIATGLWSRYGNPIIAPDCVPEPASLLPAGRRIVGRARQLPALPVDLRRRRRRTPASWTRSSTPSTSSPPLAASSPPARSRTPTWSARWTSSLASTGFATGWMPSPAAEGCRSKRAWG